MKQPQQTQKHEAASPWYQVALILSLQTFWKHHKDMKYEENLQQDWITIPT